MKKGIKLSKNMQMALLIGIFVSIAVLIAQLASSLIRFFLKDYIASFPPGPPEKLY